MRSLILLLALAALSLPALAQPVCSPSTRVGTPAAGWRATGYLTERFTGGTVTSTSQTTVAYDAGDPVLVTTTGAGPTMWTRTFDAEHRVRLSSRVTETSGTFLDEYRYDSPTAAEQRYNWRGGTDWDSYIDRRLWVYDDACRIQVIRSEVRGPSVWTETGRTDYVYAGELLMEVTQYGNGLVPDEAQVPQYQFLYTYEGTRRTYGYYLVWSVARNEWDLSQGTAYVYTPEGRLGAEYVSNWVNNNQWVYSRVREYLYSDEGNVVVTTLLTWNGSGFVPTLRFTYSYEAIPVAAEAAPESRTALAVAGANPFAGSTRVRLSLAAPEAVAVTVHDALGRSVATLHDGPLAAGAHVWTVGGSLAPGVYIVRAAGATTAGSVRVVRSR